MGCDIHIVTQIRKMPGGQWEAVDEIPESMKQRNYELFAFLADVRNYFQIKGFKPKGLPDDLGGRRFLFDDYAERLPKEYSSAVVRKVVLPNGEYIDLKDERLAVKCQSEEEARKYEHYSLHYPLNTYIGYDPLKMDGKEVDVHVKDLMGFEEYCKQCYHDYWDEERQTYGIWKVDFDNEDYHSASWLTLKELDDADKSSYCSVQVKLPVSFYNAFKGFGGTFPPQMKVIEEKDRIPADFADAVQMAFNPDIIVEWQNTEEENKETRLFKGIEELRGISRKYNVSSRDIRIVFAFDN